MFDSDRLRLNGEQPNHNIRYDEKASHSAEDTQRTTNGWCLIQTTKVETRRNTDRYGHSARRIEGHDSSERAQQTDILAG